MSSLVSHLETLDMFDIVAVSSSAIAIPLVATSCAYAASRSSAVSSLENGSL